MNNTRIRIFHPADPLGAVTGGVDSFIGGLIKFAPDDLQFSVVGVTTDPQARPVRQITRCALGDQGFDFYPVARAGDAARRSRVPLAARYTCAVARVREQVSTRFDVFDFHLIEPSLLFTRDPRPKNAFFHQDPADMRSRESDVRWKHLPMASEAVESQLVPHLSSAWCVRESGVATLKQRYPAQADTFGHVSPWIDTSVFSPEEDHLRDLARRRLATRFAMDERAVRIVTTGRLATLTDSMLTLEALGLLIKERRRLVLLIVGDAELQPALQTRARELGVQDHVRFLGVLNPPDLAEVLRGSDMLVHSSARDGTPMAVLEALGCGLPVASTDVEAVRRLVTHEVNGAIAQRPTLAGFTDAIENVLDHLAQYGGPRAVSAAQPFNPALVLEPVYERYRELGDRVRLRAGRSPSATARPRITEDMAQPLRHEEANARIHEVATATARSQDPDAVQQPSRRHRESVIGAPIDVVGAAQARALILGWAKAHESRYVCFCNVHSAVTYSTDATHKTSLDRADLVAPDGAPIAWMLRRMGATGQPRIDGPGTMWALCRDAAWHGIRIGLYGTSPEHLKALKSALLRAFPALLISYSGSPADTHAETEDSDAAMCREIETAEVQLLFVALGCPAQERWMAEHKGHVSAVMLGVGPAFNFHAGLKPRAPMWMQRSGLEWLHRIVNEPGQLWRRYLFTNSVFMVRGARELASDRLKRSGGKGPVRITQTVDPARTESMARSAATANRSIRTADAARHADFVGAAPSTQPATTVPMSDAVKVEAAAAIAQATRTAQLAQAELTARQAAVVREAQARAAREAQVAAIARATQSAMDARAARVAREAQAAAAAEAERAAETARARNARPASESPIDAWSRNLDHRYMTELLARVDAQMPMRTGRVVGFIASGAGEGTSTMASSYAHTAASRLNRRVLLLTTQGDASQPIGVLEALSSHHAIDKAIKAHPGGSFTGSLLGSQASEAAWALCRRTELWNSLRDAFDEIVMDMPSSATSRVGVMLSAHCDGVIVVLEAEKTRAPVVEALVNSLRAVRANLLGTVMNKRQFHVPDLFYRHL